MFVYLLLLFNLIVTIESQAMLVKAMGKKGVKRGRPTIAKKEPSPSLENNENTSNNIHNKNLEDQNQMKRGRAKGLKREPYPVMEYEEKGKNDGNSGELVDQKQILELNHCEGFLITPIFLNLIS